MVFVKRDPNNAICAIYANDKNGELEALDNNDAEVIAFLTQCALEKQYSFLKSDLDLIRVLEDLIQILMEKNLISITDFPLPVIEKLIARQKIRKQFEDVSKLFDED
ncbi:hypothetical protein [Legionella londiniensis]|uniref:DED domain-containing protein n=1 Tax=Legionella londiniensis TaxID=45068 RepID=A0A0W0VR03_9GAMM|nr:hypothetical protein [Legionella londiniensis]KTD22610.1 hypothetical protein Llon_0484 [Legionella londiniensis]STX92541.1 Uncharacterised protein [Legionella londiniensis]